MECKVIETDPADTGGCKDDIGGCRKQLAQIKEMVELFSQTSWFCQGHRYEVRDVQTDTPTVQRIWDKLQVG